MRHGSLSLLGASFAVTLLVPQLARATTCEPPTVNWGSFPQESQCVGGVIQFVKNEWGLPFPATGGHATHDGCEALGACIEWVYDLPDKSKWTAYSWGSVAPQAYDIAVFGPVAGDAYGHIAMIDHVDGATLWLMDDNWGGLHEKSCAWAGHSGWVHSTTWQPYGVFRLKDLEPWRAEFDSQSWAGANDAPDEMTVGEIKTGWIKLKNTGGQTWPAGVVKLAPIPRDQASDLQSLSWLSPTRVSTLADDVKPGETATFDWDLLPSTAGHFEPYFGLVAEKIVWFANSGGPSDATIQLNVSVEALGTVDTPPVPSDPGRSGSVTGLGRTAGAGGGSGAELQGGALDDQDGESGGCSISMSSTSPEGNASAFGLALALAMALRRRARGAKATPA